MARWLYKLPLRLRSLLRRGRVEHELSDELRFHLDHLVREKSAQGMSPEAARTAARREFGGFEQVQEECRDMRRVNFVATCLQDLRYGMRQLRRHPGFTAAAVITLALGIGANTAIFSLMDAVMFRRLPVKDPQQLVLFGQGSRRGSFGREDGLPNRSWQLFSFPFYREVQHGNGVFSGVTAILSVPLGVYGRVGDSPRPERMHALLVSGTYFSVLGAKPILGTGFTAADDEPAGGHPIAVLNYAWWAQRLGRDPAVIGKKLTIQATDYTIVGVAPPGFFGAEADQVTDFWIPVSMEKQVSPGWNGLEDPWFQSNDLLARLKPGVTRPQAEANVNLLFRRALHGLAGPQPTAKQLQDIEHARIELTPAGTGLSVIRSQASMALEALMAVVGLVLLIACANVASLLLSRATTRHREMEVRKALGAARSRLVRQLLTESMLLAGLGGTLGIALAWGALRLLVTMVSPGSQPLPMSVMPNGSVLIFTLTLTVLTAIGFGIAPALRASQSRRAIWLNGRGASPGRVGNRLVRALIVAQVALSLVLLAGAGLFVRSLVNLRQVNVGFNEQNVLLFSIDESAAGYKEDAQLTGLLQGIEQRVARQPGVKAASFSFFTFSQGQVTTQVFVPGQSGPSREVWQNTVGRDYFRTMGIPLLGGRLFGDQDTAASPPVAVINQTMARTLFPNALPIGRRFSVGRPDASTAVEIVGVVKDVKYDSLSETPRPEAYYFYPQHPQYLADFAVRYSGEPRTIISEVRLAIGESDGSLPISGVTTLASKVDDSTKPEKLMAQLSSFFGLLALFLACIGIYGTMAHAVAGRTNEVGIRMALGAQRRAILWSVQRESLVLVVMGAGLGLPAVIAVTRLIRSLLFDVAPANPVVLAAASGLVFAVAAVAGYIPARRASKSDPMVALRHEG